MRSATSRTFSTPTDMMSRMKAVLEDTAKALLIGRVPKFILLTLNTSLAPSSFTE